MPKKIEHQYQQLSLFPPVNNTISINKSDLVNNIFLSNNIDIDSLEYCHLNGLIFTKNSLDLLKNIKDNVIDLVFADPPYNIKKADWDKFNSQEDYINWSIKWIAEVSRILKPTGSLYICGFSEILADLKYPAMKFFKNCKWLVWSYKNKANLGNDWGRSHESILHLRKSNDFKLNIDPIRISYSAHTLKYPSHPQAESSQYNNSNSRNILWTPNPMGGKPKDILEIPTICNGMAEKTGHPTQKPEELLRKLILAATNKFDLVLDPFSGSGTSLVVAEQLSRKWIGCDINKEYNLWAINRIDNVIIRSIEKWIEFDKNNAKKRESIR
ncbi:MAG: site-specific DNA-methyltransferase [Deltaproteobacteria bacterium]|jgi:site-specific DNA-methyltransferase (adenine-specific)|nr:site-specific DNA-methyltransferase [Deltaproteobacteria bacterium]